ncbi:MAG TPA: YidC/Oxa1 family membrane protein insertase [Acidimicrobiales bacterium]|jgi:YidC/Oxa1 family membrane protein insertase|nr:YidC/Oxa1 family membrane protein insertase [Acidimicrobiales bacterium]
MLNGLFELIANTLNFFYTLVPNYAVAIGLLTLVVMVITTPLTLKSTRSMIEMQRLQPEIRRLQAQYKDDRQKLNEELMAFYREHEINPLGGCLPLLIQAPVFSILYYVVRGLTREATFESVQRLVRDGFVPDATVTTGFRPKYLDSDTDLYRSLLGDDEMRSFGVDLSQSPAQAFSEGFVHVLPYVLIVAVIAALSWYQQKQIMGRNPNAEITQQQQMMMRIGPLMYVFFTFVSPAAIGVYFLVSTVWRVGQQHYITHALYRGEDAPGVQAQKAMAQLRSQKVKDVGGAKETKKASGARQAGAGRAGGKAGAKGRSNGSSAKGSARPAGKASAGTRASSGKPHPRSRKKKKRK